MTFGDRKSQRVAFSKGIDATMISIDGTSQHPCIVMDISQTGARLDLSETSQSFDLAEFFLLMSTRGAVHRRCRVVRRYGTEVGVAFVRNEILRR